MKIQKTFFAGNAAANMGAIGAVARFLRISGSKATYARILEILLVPGTAENEEALKASVQVAIAIGLFDSSERSLKPTTEVAMAVDDVVSFEPKDLAETMTSQLARFSADQIETEGEVPDLSCALAWLLTSRPDRLFGSWSKEESNVLDPEDAISSLDMRDVIQNASQWIPFRRWAVSLGFGRLMPSGKATLLEPDPTDSFRVVLNSDEEISAREFQSRLSKAIPFVSTGAVGVGLRGMYPKLKSPEHDFSLVESSAIRRLESEGQLMLESNADASASDRVSIAAVMPGQSEVFDKVRIRAGG